MAKNKPYMIAVAGQFLFGVTLYGRNADALYYFTYVEGNQALFSTYSLFIIIPSIIGAACFPVVFRLTNNKGRSASIFALLTGISMFCMYFFTAVGSPVPFYLFSCLAQFFFSGFNTAIYAIVPDCVEYGEWKTGLRNDGFQYAFISLGNKIGMAIGTSVLAGVLGSLGERSGAKLIDVTLGRQGSLAYHQDRKVCGKPFLSDRTISLDLSGPLQLQIEGWKEEYAAILEKYLQP